MVRNFVDEGHFIVQLVRGKCNHTINQSWQAADIENLVTK